MFKVVADQLKIAQGWVKCGHCAEVFDASVQLQATEAGVPPALVVQEANTPERTDPAKNSVDLEKQQALPDSLPGPVPIPDEASSPLDNEPEPEPEPEPEQVDAAQDGGHADFDPAGWKQSLRQSQQQDFVAPLISESAPDVQGTLADPAPAAKNAVGSRFRDSADPIDAEAQDPEYENAEAAQEVSFVRDARRKAFWKKPLVRGFLGAFFLLLCALLILQWMVQHRDRLAALDPRLAPVLQALCGPLHCEIVPPRQIESLVIDSSTFNKTGTDTYRLGFTLKNSGDTLLEVPSMELTLTDTQDQAVLRRVLSPRQFGVNAATLAAHSELAGVVTLSVSGDAERAGPPSLSASAPRTPLRVAGYRILAFYP
jgi:predicted Zn finger-like uncharacterized protein